MTTYQAITMNKTNKTSEWRKNVGPEKKSLMVKWAKEFVSKQYQLLSNVDLR